MSIQQAAFVDLSSMNVLYKYNDKFVLGLNYSQAPLALLQDLQALGSGFELYLSLYPRLRNCGDTVIEELSAGAVPFEVDSNEIEEVYKFFISITGIGEIYLCNALANYTTVAKVEDFTSVFYIGSEVLMVSAEQRSLKSMKTFDSQQAFIAEYGEEYHCYGDTDLMDVEGLKARHPELKDIPKRQIVAVAPLIASSKTNYKVSLESLIAQNGKLKQLSKEYLAKQRHQAVEKSEQNTEVDTTRCNGASSTTGSAVKKMPRFSELRVALLALSCTLSVVLGFSYEANMTFGRAVAPRIAVSSSAEKNTSVYKELRDIYTQGVDKTYDIIAVLEYCNLSGFQIDIVGFEGYSDRYVLRGVCSKYDTITQLSEYIGKRFQVSSVNELGSVVTSSGESLQFSVTFY